MASHLHAAPRLACVKPVASVHPEPGSNSTLYNLFVLITCTFDRHAMKANAKVRGLPRTCKYFSKNFSKTMHFCYILDLNQPYTGFIHQKKACFNLLQRTWTGVEKTRRKHVFTTKNSRQHKEKTEKMRRKRNHGMPYR